MRGGGSGALLLLGAFGCSASTPASPPQSQPNAPAPLSEHRTVVAAATATAATATTAVAVADPAPVAAPVPPAGWVAWGLAPPGCTVWIPESRAALERLADHELAWKACPFQSVGCSALGAPWAARTGWGFGGRLSAISVADRTYLTVARQIEPEVWETLILSGPSSTSGTSGTSGSAPSRPVAAWRQRLPEAGCVLGSVSLTVDQGRATAALPIIRAEAENAPWIYLGAPESLAQPPEPTLAARSDLTSLDGLGAPLEDRRREPHDPTRRLESFGGPGAELLPSGVAMRRGDVLAVWEHEGRFALRDLKTGKTLRPTPPPAPDGGGAPSFRALLEPTPLGDAVVFGSWMGERNSVWLTDRQGRTQPLLADPRASFDRFTSDGAQAAWLRSTGFTDLNTFAHVELWTSTVAGSSLRSPRRLRALPAGPLPLLSIGDGWAALWRAEDDVVLVRLSDNPSHHEVRRLPAVPQLSWDGGSGGLVIAGGAVWARASLRGQAGNDTRLIARFSLDALPKGTLP